MRPPVLVLGSGLTALGVIRLLGRAGLSSLVVGEHPGVAGRSRWFHAAPRSRADVDPETDLPAWLDGLPLERAVLMPCSDFWALHIADCAPVVGERFPSSLPSYASLQSVVDKGALAGLLDALALPHPRTLPVETATDADAWPDSALADVFVKPRDSATFFRQFGVKAFRVSSRAELVARLAEAHRYDLPVELQEYVPGPTSNHYYVEGFIDRDGRRRALFVRQRLRMYPPDFGNSTLFVSVSPSAIPDAVETVTTLLRHVRFRGIFSAEFKRDDRTGVCQLIEVNARPWWFVEFAGQCGVNFVEMAVLDALGETVPAVTEYSVGKSCVYPYYDYSACRDLHRAGQLSIGAWLWSWARATQPVLRWSDPVPALTETASLVRQTLASSFRRRA